MLPETSISYMEKQLYSNMQEITEERGRLDDLRTSLRNAQQAGVFASDARLSMAARETLKRLDTALEAYDEELEELLETYRAETEEGRPVRVVQGGGIGPKEVEVVRIGQHEELEPGWYEPPVNGEASKVAPERLAGADMGIRLEDGDEYHELKDQYAEQETDVKIDPVSEETFNDNHEWNEQAEQTVDLLLLRDLWLTS